MAEKTNRFKESNKDIGKSSKDKLDKLNKSVKDDWSDEDIDLEELLPPGSLDIKSRILEAKPNFVQKCGLININFNNMFLNPTTDESSLAIIGIDGQAALDIVTGKGGNVLGDVGNLGPSLMEQGKQMLINGMPTVLDPEMPMMIADLMAFVAQDLVTQIINYLTSRFSKYISPDFVPSLVSDSLMLALDVTQENLKTPDEILKELKEDAKKSLENKNKEEGDKKKNDMITNFGGYLAMAKDEINKVVGMIPQEVIDAIGKYAYIDINYTLEQVSSLYQLYLKKGIVTADKYVQFAEGVAFDFLYAQSQNVGLEAAELANELQRQALDKGIKLTMTNQSKLIIAAQALINKSIMQIMGLIGG